MLFRPSAGTSSADGRRRLLDSPRVLAGIGILLVGILTGLFWLANRTSQLAPQLLTDVLPATAKVALVEPRRMRDRANDLLAEEDLSLIHI